MVFEQLNQSIRQYGRFSEDQLSLLESRLKVLNLNKDQCLIREGQVCQTFYFINEGSFRQYLIEDSGEEATLNLYTAGEWCFDYKSFIAQQPAEGIIQAVSNSEVLALSVWDFHELARRSESFFQLGRILEQAISNQDYQHNRLTPEQKYDRLLAHKPALLQHFPLKHIASYLGMSPETLSRVRKRIAS